MTMDVTEQTSPKPTFGEAVKIWFKIGCLSFGGPAGQIAMMHRVVVDEKKWLPESRFLHALNFCMLLPGPEAQQLATYIGWLMHGLRGGLAAGILFVLPGAFVMLGLSLLYAYGRGIGLVDGALYGIKAAVLVIVVEALIRISKRALKSAWLVAVAAAAFVGIFFLALPFPLIVIGAALIGFLTARQGDVAATGDIAARPANDRWRHMAIAVGTGLSLWWLPVLAIALALGPHHVLVSVGLFFSKLAVVTFGGAYAVLAYMAQQAVDTHGWLTAPEMVDALGLAETTPGPLILVTQFVGFLAAFRDAAPFTPLIAGIAGAVLTTWVTFVPSIMWIIAGAPFIEELRGNKKLAGALAAITAAVVGVILNLSVWFALHVLFGDVTERHTGILRWYAFDPAALDQRIALLAVTAAILTFRFHRSLIEVIGVMALLGMIARMT
ncbi:chromate efflux transporter [Pseudolabrys sp. FHR47]|uniref:chromate efflux transporter n=1 Tax=Pseudolabrys sp. FHR47 TaxID=2562284 RepID=UPI0019817461|nr:chromate efflux transporter [Pseudolabrys sp. FHR47]